MKMRVKPIAALLIATALAVAAQDTKPLNPPWWRANQGEQSKLLTEVIAAKRTVSLGNPILVSVRVTNQTTAAVVASRSATAFDCFEVTGPEGERLPYIGYDGQIMADRMDVPSSASVTLVPELDLADRYLFQKPGRYMVRLSGQRTGLSDSPAIVIQVTPGRLSEFDEVAASLLPVCPTGWRLVKDGRGEVTPLGRARGSGFVLHLCRSHMRGEAVMLWFTKEEAKVDPNQQPRVKVEYVGRARGLFVYQSVGENTPALWPTASKDISRVLQMTKP
jgi:hypothetical protein